MKTGDLVRIRTDVRVNDIRIAKLQGSLALIVKENDNNVNDILHFVLDKKIGNHPIHCNIQAIDPVIYDGAYPGNWNDCPWRPKS